MSDPAFVLDAHRSLVQRLIMSSEAGDSDWEICYAYWSTLAVDRIQDWEFAQYVSLFIEEVDAPSRRALRLSNRIAWETRGQPGLPQELGNVVNSLRSSELFLVGLYLNRCRFMFQFDEVQIILDYLDESWHSHPFVEAARAFAAFGSKDGRDNEATISVQSAWQRCRNSDLLMPVRELCLQALDVADGNSTQAAVLLEYCDRHERDSLRYGGSATTRSILQYRRARALRVLGRPAEALEAIDAALSLLSGDNEFVRIFAEQCLRERDFVRFAAIMSTAQSEIRAATESVARQELKIESTIERSTIRSTEVLALFSSAVAFAVGAAAIGANARTPTAAVASISGLALGLLGFVGMIVYVVSATTSINRDRVVHGHTRHQRFLIGAAFGLGIFGSIIGVLSLYESTR